jgi:hypothetical protein
MSRKAKPTELTTYRGILPIDSSPLADLALARGLLQRSLDENQIVTACCYAMAITKLIGPACNHAIENNQLLAAPACARVVDAMVSILEAWLSENEVPDHHVLVGRITELFANEISP